MVIHFVHPHGTRQAGEHPVVGDFVAVSSELVVQVTWFVPAGQVEKFLVFRAGEIAEKSVEINSEEVLDHLINGPDVDFCFSTAGDAVDQQSTVRLFSESVENGVECLSLVVIEV